MNNSLEQINVELTLELYETNEKLRNAEQMINDLNLRQSQEISCNYELNQLKIQLQDAEERISMQDTIINNLLEDLERLRSEKAFLVSENDKLFLQSEPKIENFLDISSISTAGPAITRQSIPSPPEIKQDFFEISQDEPSTLIFKKHPEDPQCLFSEQSEGSGPNSPLEFKSEFYDILNEFPEKSEKTFKTDQEEPQNTSKSHQESPKSPAESSEQNRDTALATIAKKLKLGLDEKTSPKDESPSKSSEMRFFVGHLCPSINETALKKYFSTFGEVIDIFFPNDTEGKSRGFAFVTFSRIFDKHPMKTPRHVIDGREIYVDYSQYKQGNCEPTKTILASGIIHDSTDEAILNHFSKYGKVIKVIRPKESRRKYSRWAFIVFEHCKGAEKALNDPIHEIDGHGLDLRCARNFKFIKKRDESVSTKPVSVTQLNTPNIPKPKLTVDKNQAVDVKKLLIQNLNPDTTTDTIRKYFSKFGTILDAYIPTVYGTNNSKGFGYIVMPTNEINFGYSSHVIDGRTVQITKESISYATEKTATLLVSAGPEVMAKVDEEDLKNFFKRFGKIISVRKPQDSYNKKTSHYAFVEFAECAAVEKALVNMAYKINGQIVCITKSRFDPHK